VHSMYETLIVGLLSTLSFLSIPWIGRVISLFSEPLPSYPSFPSSCSLFSFRIWHTHLSPPLPHKHFPFLATYSHTWMWIVQLKVHCMESQLGRRLLVLNGCVYAELDFKGNICVQRRLIAPTILCHMHFSV
jgi:hypothetical protein